MALSESPGQLAAQIREASAEDAAELLQGMSGADDVPGMGLMLFLATALLL